MGLSPQTTRTGGEDFRWLGSRHGFVNAKSYLLDGTKFPAAQYPGGVVPSGQTLALVANKAVPFDPASTTGAQNFLGVLTVARDVSEGDELGPVMWHGLIHSTYLPATSKVPAAAAAGQLKFA